MNESTPRHIALSISLGVLFLLAACSRESSPPPLQGASIGGPFNLTDQNGNRVRDTQFTGRYRLVYFGYTFCPDVCPTDLQKIGAGLRRFEQDEPERAARVQPIFITIDPRRDTPEVLRRYVPNFHPRLIGLTGSEAEIASVARSYRVFRQLQAPPAGRPNDYLVDHSSNTVLYGPEGRPVAIIPTDQGAGAVAGELDRWVQ